MPVPWQYYDSSMTVPWQYHYSTMTVSWKYHDSTITVPWQFHDSNMTVPGTNTIFPGGMNITVIGSNFNLIQRPLLVIRTPTIPTTKRSIDHPTPGDDADDNDDNDDKDDAEDADTGKDEVTPPSDYFIEVEEKKKDEIVKCGDDASGGFTGTAVAPVEFSNTTLVYTMPNDMPHSYQYGFKMDNVSEMWQFLYICYFTFKLSNIVLQANRTFAALFPIDK